MPCLALSVQLMGHWVGILEGLKADRLPDEVRPSAQQPQEQQQQQQQHKEEEKEKSEEDRRKEDGASGQLASTAAAAGGVGSEPSDATAASTAGVHAAAAAGDIAATSPSAHCNNVNEGSGGSGNAAAATTTTAAKAVGIQQVPQREDGRGAAGDVGGVLAVHVRYGKAFHQAHHVRMILEALKELGSMFLPLPLLVRSGVSDRSGAGWSH